MLLESLMTYCASIKVALFYLWRDILSPFTSFFLLQTSEDVPNLFLIFFMNFRLFLVWPYSLFCFYFRIFSETPFIIFQLSYRISLKLPFLYSSLYVFFSEFSWYLAFLNQIFKSRFSTLSLFYIVWWIPFYYHISF